MLVCVLFPLIIYSISGVGKYKSVANMLLPTCKAETTEIG